MKKLLQVAVLLLFPSAVFAACSNTSLGNGVTCVQQCINGGSFSTSSATCGFGSNTTSGHLLVFSVDITSATITISSINCSGSNSMSGTTHSPIVGTGIEVSIWYVVASSACQSFTVTTSAGWTGDVIGEEYSGLASSSPLNCDTTTGTGSSTSLATNSCTTQAGSESASATSNTNTNWAMLMAAFKTSSGSNVLLVAVGSQANGSTYTAGGSYTIRQQTSGTGHGGMLEDLTVAGAATNKGMPPVVL